MIGGRLERVHSRIAQNKANIALNERRRKGFELRLDRGQY
jgi:hypothetical protein